MESILIFAPFLVIGVLGFLIFFTRHLREIAALKSVSENQIGTCEKCGGAVSVTAKFCTTCGHKITDSINRASNLKLDCAACRGAQTMLATGVPRFSSVVRALGVMIFVVGGLVFVFALVPFLGSVIVAIKDTSGSARGVTSIGLGMSFIFVLISLGIGILGWLFFQNRNVWKCSKCGCILDRA